MMHILISLLLLSILITGVAVIIGVSIYDVRAVRYEQLARQHPHSRLLKKRLTISVIVHASSDLDLMEKCLDSIVRNKYRKTEVIIVDTLTRSTLRHRIKKYTSRHSGLKVSIFKTIRRFDTAVIPAYTRYGTGDIILSVDSASYIDARTLHRLNRHFLLSTNVSAFMLNRQVIMRPKLVSIFKAYAQLLRNVTKKTISSVGVSFHSGYINTAIRKEALLDSKKGYYQKNIAYSDDTLIYYEASRMINISKMNSHHLSLKNLHINIRKNRYQWVLILLGILIQSSLLVFIGYTLYLAFVLHQPALFGASLLMTTTVLSFAIWSDRYLSQYQKVNYSILIPIAYAPAYLLALFMPFISLHSAFRFYLQK